MARGTGYDTREKEEFRRLGERGQVETSYRIWAVSEGGTRFHVDVAEEDLDKAGVALSKRAKELDAI